MAVRMELARILIRETDDTHVVELREAEGERIFPIVIGFTEAAAIERRLMGHKPPRPQTHELLAGIITALGAQIEKIIIADLKEHTFFARLLLRQGDRLVEMDCRPSDAIALGVATEVPIFAAEHVLDAVTEQN
ncbi:MAG: bifunctional nuclease family protein [Phycisphaeraceae bacterium]|nr:bifunctional nuclease family protein [Phycisphaeraceae bacterium]